MNFQIINIYSSNNHKFSFFSETVNVICPPACTVDQYTSVSAVLKPLIELVPFIVMGIIFYL